MCIVKNILIFERTNAPKTVFQTGRFSCSSSREPMHPKLFFRQGGFRAQIARLWKARCTRVPTWMFIIAAGRRWYSLTGRRPPRKSVTTGRCAHAHTGYSQMNARKKHSFLYHTCAFHSASTPPTKTHSPDFLLASTSRVYMRRAPACTVRALSMNV